MLQSAMNRTDNISHWKRLGKVKLGLKIRGKAPSPVKCSNAAHAHTDDCFNMYPKDVDYFVLPPELQAKLGAQPRLLKIMLAFPTLQQNFDVRAAKYVANGSKWCHTIDGITAHRLDTIQVPNPKFGKPGEKPTVPKTIYKDMPCPGAECPYRLNKECPPRGYFEFMVPELFPEVGTLFMKVGSGVAQDQMLATLRSLEYFCQARPNGMYGVRLDFERVKREFKIDTKGDGTLTAIEKWIPQISIDFKSLLKQDRELLMPMVGQQLAIPAVATAEDIDTSDDEDDQPAAGKIIDQPVQP